MNKFYLVLLLAFAGCESSTFKDQRKTIEELREENLNLRRRVNFVLENPQVRYVPNPMCASNEDWLKWDDIRRAAERACKSPRKKVGSIKLRGSEYEVVE